LALDGEGETGLFQVGSGVTATVSGLTIEDGSAGQGGGVWNNGGNLTLSSDNVINNVASGNGGGVDNSGDLSLSGCTLAGNKAENGGGVFSGAGTLSVSNSTFTNNEALNAGGGVYSQTSLSVMGAMVDDNYVSAVTSGEGSNSSSYGGGIYAGGYFTIASSTISGNSSNASGNDVSASYGGGIYSVNNTTGSSITQTNIVNNAANSTVVGAQANSYGGGYYNVGVVSIVASSLADNGATSQVSQGIYSPYYSSAYGAGFYNQGTATVSNSTVADNTTSATGGAATTAGGGIAGGNITVANSTIALDGAAVGGGIDGAATLTATIIAENSGQDCSTSVTDEGYNIDDDGTCGFSTPSIDDYATLSRTLGPLASNGGPTQTIALLAANPAIEYVPKADCPVTDQRGYTRTAPCDIGAYDTDGLTPQFVNFTSTPPSHAYPGGPTYTVTATGGGSGNPVTFSIDPTTQTECSIAGSVVSFQDHGSCTIDANQAGNGSYAAAAQVQQSFGVLVPPPTIAKFRPGKGKVGKEVTITGTNLGSATMVKFNGTSATIVSAMPNQLVTKVPAGAATGPITIDTLGWTVTSARSFKVT